MGCVSENKSSNLRALLGGLDLENFLQSSLALRLCGKFFQENVGAKESEGVKNEEWCVSERLTPGLSYL